MPAYHFRRSSPPVQASPSSWARSPSASPASIPRPPLCVGDNRRRASSLRPRFFDTVLQTLPKHGHARLSVWFLLLRRQFHTGPSPRARAGSSTGVLTVRGTPGQFLEIEGGIQIPIQD